MNNNRQQLHEYLPNKQAPVIRRLPLREVWSMDKRFEHGTSSKTSLKET
mgnify:CR=1 FL=1